MLKEMIYTMKNIRNVKGMRSITTIPTKHERTGD